ncbi:MAG TPA: hypothetical protein VMN60_05950 [Longimicrobiales bacterium]|nr:hypothetical protein [Longimicrobiales bacterium]
MITPRILLTLVVCAAGCVRTTYETVEVTPDPVRQQEQLYTARNLPQAFTIVTAARAPGDCPPQLADPMLGTTLTLQRSVLLPAQDSAGTAYRAFGDYAVAPPGRYGEGAGQGLRVDCLRVRALGVVPLR